MGQRSSVYQSPTRANLSDIFHEEKQESEIMYSKGNSSIVIRSMKPGRCKALAKELESTSADDIPSLTPEQLLSKFTNIVSSSDEQCSICMCDLKKPSGFCEDGDKEGTKVIELVHCSHVYHKTCIRQMLNTTASYLECPICKTIHGIRIGNQPDGLMDIMETSESLVGHPDCGTITITYFFKNGIQGPNHPEPGQPYLAHAFPRRAYLPNDTKGKKVLRLLQEAWKRRLVFTIGTSVTSGLKNVITWNEIHHKTSMDNYNGHGYPDPAYLDNVMMELALQGVTEASIQ